MRMAENSGCASRQVVHDVRLGLDIGVCKVEPSWTLVRDAGLQFASHTTGKVEHSARAEIDAVRRAARKNSLPGQRGERRHLAEQKGAVGRLQCRVGEDIEHARRGTTPVSPGKQACIVCLEARPAQHAILACERWSSSTRPFCKADRSRRRVPK